MKKLFAIIITAIVMLPSILPAQETYFGKNKVRYKNFEWSYIQTRHFDIYFYEDAYPLAKFTSTVLESSYVEIARELNYYIQDEIPVFIYNSHNDFQQTNITPGILPEGVGGFTEAFKNRIVIPFNGSYEELRHVLHHELTHAVIYDMIYGNIFSSLVSKRALFNLPLWFAEGYAEYSSRHGWDYFADMFVRDATVNNYLTPPQYLGGFLAYKQGQAMVKFIADEYGEEKLGEILQKGKIHLTIGKAIKQTLGISMEKLWKDFSKEMKKRYWPDIAIREDVEDISKKLTKAREDGSYFNVKPEISPDGETIAYFTDKSDFTEIVLMSTEDGKMTKRVIKSQRSADLESLHSFVSGLSFSPDGNSIVFVAKSKGREALYFHDIDRGKTYLKKITDFYNIISPVWSPDGKKIAFSALNKTGRDLFVYDIESDVITQHTEDVYDDLYPSWMPNSNELVFSTDRPHPQSKDGYESSSMYVKESAFKPGEFTYGNYNIYRIDLTDDKLEAVDVGPGSNKYPRVSPNGKEVSFISNRNGIDNLYVGYLDTVKYYALTDIMTGIHSISWSPDGDNLAFSAFNQGAFDIFILEELIPVGDDGVLTATDFVLGKYHLLDTISNSGEEKDVDTDSTKSNDSLVVAVASDSSEVAQETDSLEVLATTDSSTTDSTQTEVASLAVETDSSATAIVEDSIISETGIYDDEYVFVGEEEEVIEDSLFTDIGDGRSLRSKFRKGLKEPEEFDERPQGPLDGEYEIIPYKTKFTADYVGGGFSYNTFFGLSGQTYFVFSDYLGNHQLYLATDLVNTIDQSNIQVFYSYNKHRTSYGGGFFHSKYYYRDNNNFTFSDRFYGLQFFARRPFSTFGRLEMSISQTFIDRQFYDFFLGDPRDDRNTEVASAELSYVTDNILWGITGPLSGKRTKFTITKAINLFGSSEIEFSSAEFDFRRYWHFNKTYSFAIRFAGGYSTGKTPKQYFLGGTTSYVGRGTLNAEVYTEKNLHFSDVVTPLRGIDYYGINGSRYGLFNMEFRYPMIDYFVMRFPLQLVLSKVSGAMFLDMGAAWDEDSGFKGGTSAGGSKRLAGIKAGYGFGMRANLGFLLLRYDLAWATDLNSTTPRPKSYFSFGAEF